MMRKPGMSAEARKRAECEIRSELRRKRASLTRPIFRNVMSKDAERAACDLALALEEHNQKGKL